MTRLRVAVLSNSLKGQNIDLPHETGEYYPFTENTYERASLPTVKSIKGRLTVWLNV